MSKSDWTRKTICEGYFFMVAIDNQMRPIPIPQFIPTNESEIAEQEKAIEIRNHMLELKNKS
jgi:acyl-CoA hydrolase